MKKLKNFTRTNKINSRNLFFLLPVIALFALATMFLWQPSAEMQNRNSGEQQFQNSKGESPNQRLAPEAIVYTSSTMTGQTIVPGTVNTGNAGDDATTAITLPFAFNFYGSPFTSANVSSNGNLQFTSNSTGFSNVCPLPTNTLNNAILPFWDDLRTDMGTGSGIFTSVSGTAPNRIFNIEWRAVYFATPTSTVNFEIRLYETGQIDYVYGTLNGTGDSATVGLQKADGRRRRNV